MTMNSPLNPLDQIFSYQDFEVDQVLQAKKLQTNFFSV